jgi:hypothetical protein
LDEWKAEVIFPQKPLGAPRPEHFKTLEEHKAKGDLSARIRRVDVSAEIKLGFALESILQQHSFSSHKVGSWEARDRESRYMKPLRASHELYMKREADARKEMALMSGCRILGRVIGFLRSPKVER